MMNLSSENKCDLLRVRINKMIPTITMEIPHEEAADRE